MNNDNSDLDNDSLRKWTLKTAEKWPGCVIPKGLNIQSHQPDPPHKESPVCNKRVLVFSAWTDHCTEALPLLAKPNLSFHYAALMPITPGTVCQSEPQREKNITTHTVKCYLKYVTANQTLCTLNLSTMDLSCNYFHCDYGSVWSA